MTSRPRLGPLLGGVGVEGDAADGRARGDVEPRRQQRPSCGRLSAAVELGVQEEVDLLGRDPAHGLLAGDQPLVGHVDGDAHGRLGGALAVAGLQHPELAALDGELHVLHVAVVRSRRRGDRRELGVGRASRSASSAMRRVARVPATTSSPWALTRKSPSSFGSPVVTLRDMATPVAESSPRLPNTIVWTFTAVPRSWGMPAALR